MNWYRIIRLSQSSVGYRVMTLNENGETIDGLPLQVGAIHSKPSGLYLSLDPKYVIQYYSHGSDEAEDPQEVLAKYRFDPNAIMSGNLTDRETEFTVPSAELLDFKYLHPK